VQVEFVHISDFTALPSGVIDTHRIRALSELDCCVHGRSPHKERPPEAAAMYELRKLEQNLHSIKKNKDSCSQSFTFDAVLKKLDLGRIGPERTAHLRHTRWKNGCLVSGRWWCSLLLLHGSRGSRRGRHESEMTPKCANEVAQAVETGCVARIRDAHARFEESTGPCKE
jgi:hypothetical protein